MSHKSNPSESSEDGKRRLNLKQLRRFPKFSYVNESLYNFNMNLCKLLYEKTDNPLYVWEALKRAIGAQKSLPEWVLLYLEETASGLFNVVLGTEDRRPRKLASALKINEPKGKSYKEFDQDLNFYYRVEELREDHTLEQSLSNAKSELKINRGQESIKKHYYDTEKIIKAIYK